MKKIMILIAVVAFLSGCGKRIEYVVGQVGPQGDRGLTGDTGASGTDGQSCSVSAVAAGPSAPNGGSLITCPNGSSLVLNGSNGENGAAGSPGTVVSSVQLCPGTTTYPSTFIEVAFKINNLLYAVYSLNGGFMTQLPPGNYSSNAVGSSCNFTVNADLTISH